MSSTTRTSPPDGPARRLLRRARRYAVAPVVALLATGLALPAQSAWAFDTLQTQIVSDNPANWTPNVMDAQGSVRSIAQFGNTMIAGGNFTQVENYNSTTPVTRNNVFKFDASTGALDPNWAPSLDGLVYEVLVAPGG